MSAKRNKIMNRRGLIILGFLVSGFYQGMAQEPLLASEKYPELRYYPLQGEVFFADYQTIKGNAYLNDDWQSGDVFVSGNQIIKNSKFRVDIYSQQILVYNDFLKRTVKPDTKYIDGFRIVNGNTEHVFKKVNYNFGFLGGKPNYFVEVLHEGNLAFYKLYIKTILPVNTSGQGYSDAFYPAVHYYTCNHGKYKEVKLRKSSLLADFPQYKSELKTFIRQEKLRLKKEDDFSKAVEYLDQVIIKANQ
jgi:hypothetical protein